MGQLFWIFFKLKKKTPELKRLKKKIVPLALDFAAKPGATGEAVLAK